MSRREQIKAVVCAILLLASVVAVAIRVLAGDIASVEFKAGLVDNPVPDPTLANRLNTTSMAKAPPIRKPQVSQSSSLEILSPGDEGSLWDEGPAYDLSR
jgi:hypothetical protein